MTYMDEGRCDEYACTEVLAGEEDLWRDPDPLDFLGHHWKAGSC